MRSRDQVQMDPARGKIGWCKRARRLWLIQLLQVWGGSVCERVLVSHYLLLQRYHTSAELNSKIRPRPAVISRETNNSKMPGR